MVAKNEPTIYEEVIHTEWYVVINDLVGGHAVSTVNYPLSSGLYSKRNRILNSTSTGTVPAVVVADFANEEIAKYIVELHNRNITE